MNLVPEWKATIQKAWSIRFALLSGLFGGIEAFLPLFSDAVPRGIFAGLCMVTSMGTVISRVVMQKELRNGTADKQ